MKNYHLILVGLFTCGGNLSASAEENKVEVNVSEAQAIVQQFAGQLKPALQAAIAEGGPVNAINVCAEKAPEIARSLSEQSGWKVRRVSLKARNPSAVPDAWEKNVLEKFDQAIVAGQSPQSLAHQDIVNGQFRFMKAQGVEPLCLNCHGSNLAEDVLKTLRARYPEDRATGYELGQVRGAISLVKDPS
ncbi:MAG: DUF3365 domain-containing protein [Hahellaceae bacterium]|nr:DUF3365 domain-containing protein [Hahellaceae bacterium]